MYWKQRMDRIFDAIDDAEAGIVFLCKINTVKQNELKYPEKCESCKAPEESSVSLTILWDRVDLSLRPGSRMVSRIFPRSHPDEKRCHWRKFMTVILEETPTLAVSQRKA